MLRWSTRFESPRRHRATGAAWLGVTEKNKRAKGPRAGDPCMYMHTSIRAHVRVRFTTITS